VADESLHGNGGAAPEKGRCALVVSPSPLTREKYDRAHARKSHLRYIAEISGYPLTATDSRPNLRPNFWIDLGCLCFGVGFRICFCIYRSRRFASFERKGD